jgi:hypothetical protein
MEQTMTSDERAELEALRALQGGKVKMTKWKNPLDREWRMTILDDQNRPTNYVIPPGESVLIPSKYDYAVQVVVCAAEECKNRPCRRGHPGKITGGLGHLLRREGGPHLELHGSMTPESVAAAEEETRRAIKRPGER